MRKYIFYILILVVFPIKAQTKVGSTAAPFLSIGVGPRSISMGGAFIATADDATSLYWNPAGAARTGNNSALFAHSQWFADINFNWAGAVIQLENMGAVGLSINYLDYGRMEVTTLREPDGTGELFSAHDFSVGLSYSHNLTDRFSIGGTIKYIGQAIWNSSAAAVAVDIGTLFISDIYGLRIGAAISNFGTDMRIDGKDLLVLYDINREIYGNNDQIMASLNTNDFPLPLTFKVGLAMDVLNTPNHKITLAVDALHPNDNAESINIGGEYIFANMFSFRGGYKSLFLDNSEEGFTLGVGINYDFAPDLGIFIDYAYQDFGLLKYTQHFSIGIKF
jgi:opacity protein-like surface antigen